MVKKFETVAEAASVVQSHRILAAPVLSMAQVIDEDPQTRAREMIVEMEHPTLGPFKYLNSPLRFTNSRAYVDESPPVAIGEHSDYVLRDVLELDDEEIKKLIENGVVSGLKV